MNNLARFPTVPAGYPVALNCTVARHRHLGTHAVINARSGEAWRNDTYRAWSMARVQRLGRAHGLQSKCLWCGRPIPFMFSANLSAAFCDPSCRHDYYY